MKIEAAVADGTTQRIPSLDGWRGIAIAMVLFDHIQFAATDGYLRPWTQTGRHGVTIFFVLSGFLITSNLIAGPINLKRFYIRRFFRLMPAAWLFLGTTALFDLLTGMRLTSWADIRACLFFYRNYTGLLKSNIAGHFWSLSIEEQFYLVWPCLLVLFGLRRCRWIAAATAVCIASFRWLMWQHYQDKLLANRTEVRADALLVGCLMALLLSDSMIRERVLRWSKFCALPAGLGLMLGIGFFHLLQPLWESVCIAVLLSSTMLHPNDAISRIISSKPLTWLGTISYSLYLWQELFMVVRRNPLLLATGICLVLPVCALGSYFLVERPTTRLGRRLTAPSPDKPLERSSILVPVTETD